MARRLIGEWNSRFNRIGRKFTRIALVQKAREHGSNAVIFASNGLRLLCEQHERPGLRQFSYNFWIFNDGSHFQAQLNPTWSFDISIDRSPVYQP